MAFIIFCISDSSFQVVFTQIIQLILPGRDDVDSDL